MRCTGKTKAGTKCRAQATAGGDRCLRHSHDPAAKAQALDAAQRGGKARAAQLERLSANPLDPLEVDDLDLESVAGLKTYLARALRRLGEMPFDIRVGHCLGQLVHIQRGLLETSDLEERVAELEAHLSLHAA